MKSPMMIPGIAGLALFGLAAAALSRVGFVRQRVPALARASDAVVAQLPSPRATATVGRAAGQSPAKRAPAKRTSAKKPAKASAAE